MSADAGSEVGLGPRPDAGGSSTLRRIVFAADFDTGGSCRDHGSGDRCDLYTASVDFSDGTVSAVTKITSTDVSESYPAWHPNGKVVYFTIFKDARNKDLGYVDLATGKSGVLIAGARWATVSPDGATLLYVEDASSMILAAPLGADGLTVGKGIPLTGTKEQEDPDYSFDGRYVVFHEVTANMGAVGQVFDTQTKKTTSWGEASGHCAFGGSSLLTLCDNSRGGGILAKTYKDGAFGATSTFLADQKASAISAFDPEMAGCQGVSFNYPTFCGDDTHLLVSTSCNQNGEVTFSRLFLVDLTAAQPVYRPIGKALAEAYGKSGKSSWTVSCAR